jgi:hypothetical protein
MRPTCSGAEPGPSLAVMVIQSWMLKALRAHLGMACSSVGRPVVVPQKTHGFTRT